MSGIFNIPPVDLSKRRKYKIFLTEVDFNKLNWKKLSTGT